MIKYIWLHIELGFLKLQGWWIANEIESVDAELAKWERIAARTK